MEYPAGRACCGSVKPNHVVAESMTDMASLPDGDSAIQCGLWTVSLRFGATLCRVPECKRKGPCRDWQEKIWRPPESPITQPRWSPTPKLKNATDLR